MNTCDTCKFWTGEQGDFVSIPVEYRECQSPKIDSEHKPSELNDGDMAFVAAADFRPAVFATSPKFGCIHHEPKCKHEDKETLAPFQYKCRTCGALLYA